MIREIGYVLSVTTIESFHLCRYLVQQLEEILFVARGHTLILLIVISYPVEIFAGQLPLIQCLHCLVTSMPTFLDKARLVIHGFVIHGWGMSLDLAQKADHFHRTHGSIRALIARLGASALDRLLDGIGRQYCVNHRQ